jgi:sulfur transfer complex TusBCD TusB component (DsrH family)
VAKGIAVYAVAEDLHERGASDDAIVDGVGRIQQAGVAKLIAAYDRVWRW